MLPRVPITPLALSLAALAWLAPISRAQQPPGIDPARAKLATSISQLIEDAIPLSYDKQKDWGAAKEIVVGLRTEGSGFHTKIHRRKKGVDHGVWKHYKLRMVEPEKNLSVQLTRLEPVTAGRAAFTLRLDVKLDAWARAKVYQYGVHLIALEVEGDMRMRLEISGEIALEVTAVDGAPGMTVLPRVTNARLDFDEFNLRRVSNAHGPLVRELGDGLRHIVEDEFNGPQLVDKLNRAIEKKRDKLVFSAGDWLVSGWWQVSQLLTPTAAVSP